MKKFAWPWFRKWSWCIDAKIEKFLFSRTNFYWSPKRKFQFFILQCNISRKINHNLQILQDLSSKFRIVITGSPIPRSLIFISLLTSPPIMCVFVCACPIFTHAQSPSTKPIYRTTRSNAIHVQNRSIHALLQNTTTKSYDSCFYVGNARIHRKSFFK